LTLVRESKDFVESKGAGADGANEILGSVSVEAVVNLVTVRGGTGVKDAWIQGIAVSLNE
jgi:hypothetical protein